MQTLFLLLASLFSRAEITPSLDLNETMQFQYEPAEGEVATDCVHERIRDLPDDWTVTCKTPFARKNFAAHVIVREIPRGGVMGYEILYWITERGATPDIPPKFHSTTAFLHIKDASALLNFSLSQGVENDYANLVLRWRKPLAADASK